MEINRDGENPAEIVIYGGLSGAALRAQATIQRLIDENTEHELLVSDVPACKLRDHALMYHFVCRSTYLRRRLRGWLVTRERGSKPFQGMSVPLRALLPRRAHTGASACPYGARPAYSSGRGRHLTSLCRSVSHHGHNVILNVE